MRTEAEQALLEQSRKLTATELVRAGRHIAAVVDPDGEERAAEAALDREERAAHLQRFLSVVGDGAGGIRIKGYGSTEDGEVIRAALLPLTKPAPAVDPDDPTCTTEKDPRDNGARMWDALVQTAQHALDTNLPPESHGARPRVAVTTTSTHLRSDLGAAGRPRPVSSSRSPPSDGSPATPRSSPVLGADGKVLDVGRAKRLVTAAIWIALILRDSTAPTPAAPDHPRCATPPHHHWVDGGKTSLENLVLLCGEHHRGIHHTPWEVRLAKDGETEFLPPRRDNQIEQAWIRHRPRRE